ncbi:MAG TPA: alpha/beta hydrolase [Gemmatimonadales bacterium]|nr:alpha/beta hydrolase [Gemmatimonadales bacterium]
MGTTLRLTRAAFGAVQRASPDLAARWAERLFCSPPRRPISERMAAWLRDGQRFDVIVGRRRVAAWTWGARGPGVLLAHGWGSRGARFVDLGGALLAAGHRVVTFDAPGHGVSQGRLSSGLEFARAAIAVAAAVGPVSAVVGHSLGGFASALAMHRGLTARRAVFIAPSANVNSYSAQFAALLGVTPPVMSSMRARLARRLDFSWSSMDVPAFAPGMRVPLLVIHDRDDREVRWGDGAAIAQAWPGAELVSTTGLGHHRIVSDAEVIANVVAFLRASLE